LELGDVGEVKYNADPELVAREILGDAGKGVVKTTLKYGEYAVASTIADTSGIRRGGHTPPRPLLHLARKRRCKVSHAFTYRHRPPRPMSTGSKIPHGIGQEPTSGSHIYTTAPSTTHYARRPPGCWGKKTLCAQGRGVPPRTGRGNGRISHTAFNNLQRAGRRCGCGRT